MITPWILSACLLTGIPVGECRAEAMAQDLTAWSMEIHAAQAAAAPPWATPAWQNYAAHIVAGESPAGCAVCDLWIACTIRRDVERGWAPWNLAGRWHGWQATTTSAQREAVTVAMQAGGCDAVPRCRYLGNTRDFQYNWTGTGAALVVGNKHGLIVCVPEEVHEPHD